jgi:hypothetical protein
MSGYSKLFSSIVTSTVWCEDNATRIVWVAMLATCDASGIVEGSVPGFANLARVTTDEMRHALNRLMDTDPDSRTPDNAGRRIEQVPGGWRILNYAAYREKGQAKPTSRAAIQQAYRDRKRNALPDVTSDGNALPGVTAPASASAYASAYQGESIDGTRIGDWAGPIPEDEA